MRIRAYNKKEDEEKLMKIIEAEGKEWNCYTNASVSEKYRLDLNNSITYVAYDGDSLYGFSRSIEDNGFYVYVYDLLVKPAARKRNIGRKLMECIYTDYPNHIVYVLSDVDEYYKKQGYKREGSIYEVTKENKF